jgi:hypothetical protein
MEDADEPEFEEIDLSFQVDNVDTSELVRVPRELKLTTELNRSSRARSAEAAALNQETQQSTRSQTSLHDTGS